MDAGSKERKDIVSGQGRFRPYPEYRNSGVEWLGEIPSHWSVDRIKQTTSGCKNGVWGDEPNGLHDVVCIRVADFDRRTFRVRIDKPTFRSIDSRIAATRMLSPGELLIEKSGGGEKQLVGAVVRFGHDLPAICSNFIARMQISPSYDSRFLCYLHASAYAVRLNLRSIKQSTGIQNLDSEAYLNERASIPPLCEQCAIAEFLDRETAKIDALMVKKERLIELLQEKRSSLITHAVTKGLDPDVPMKDSGVEWLGEIPAHWETKRLNQSCEILRGKFTHRPRNDPTLYEGHYPFIQTGDVSRARKEITDYRQTLNERGLSVSKLFPSGTLVMTIAANIGDVAVLDFAACFPDSVVGFVPRRGIERDFLFYVFLAMKPELLREAPVNTQGNLNIERIGSTGGAIPVLSVSEQRAIAAFLDRETCKIDVLIAKIREAIDRLKELRTALISAAVTGKIDVREAA